MKKIFALFAAVMLVASASAKHEIGGIVGGLNGVSYKYWFNGTMAIQADLAVGLTQAATKGFSYGMWDFTINPNFLYHWQLPANFKIYTGGGINFGMASGIGAYAAAGYGGYGGYGDWTDWLDYLAPKRAPAAYDPYEYGYGYGSAIMGKFGINAVVGAAYHIAQAPVVLAVDFRPGYGLGFTKYSTAHFFDWKLALAVRYAF